MTWTTYVLVALGGALGAAVRHLVGVAGDRADGLPLGTVVANLTGCLLLGVLTGASLDGAVATFAGVGLCGALTTYSSFVVQSHDRGGRLGAATVVITVAPALLLYAVGVAVGSLVR